MKKFKVISSILIPRTGKYFQSGKEITNEDVTEEEATSLIKKKALAAIKAEPAKEPEEETEKKTTKGKGKSQGKK